MILSCLSQTSALAPGQSGRLPSPRELGLEPAVYLGSGFYHGPAIAGQVDTAAVRAFFGRVPAKAVVVLDLEPWLREMFTVDPLPAPKAHRALYAGAIARLVEEIRATPNGPSFVLTAYQTIIGNFHPDNGGVWMKAYLDANWSTFMESYLGVPRGVLALFDWSCLSAYRVYEDADLHRRRVEGMAKVVRGMCPGKPLLAFVWPRFPQSFGDPDRRFDFMPGAMFVETFEHAASVSEHQALWDTNIYGPDGTKAKDREKYGYAKAGGSAWDPRLGWWHGMQGILERRRQPVVVEVKRDQVVALGGRDNR